MEKAYFSTTEDKVQLHIPFSKAGVNVEKRTVSGYATIDNADQTDDVVTNESSIEAWKSWRGNVREQHGDLAAGRVLDYHPEEFVDEHGKVYTGMYANVYVSKGAPTTWEKVLDGTLSGFSIGGEIQECHTEYIPDEERTIRYITKYRMVELSLVDSPMNQHCNILSVQKADDGTAVYSGMAMDTAIDSVFWCSEDRIAVAAHADMRKCSACDSEMENIGWFEPVEGQATKDAIHKVLQANNKLEKKFDAAKGGSEMSDETKEEVKTVDEDVITTDDTENKADTTEEEAEVVKKADEPDLATITKALGEIQATLSESGEKNRAETVEQIQKAVASVKEDVDAKLEELLQKHVSLEQEVKGFKDNLGTVEKSLKSVLGAVEKSSAGKKSADVEDDTSLEKADKQEGFWSSRFLPTTYDQ
jgi:hypothetical protein